MNLCSAFFRTRVKSDHSLNQDEMLANINQNDVKSIAVNSPNNPPRHVLTVEEQRFIKDVVEDRNFFIISDEIYSEYMYVDNPIRTIVSESENCRNNLVVVKFQEQLSVLLQKVTCGCVLQINRRDP